MIIGANAIPIKRSGGKRPGSGRKKITPKNKRFNITLTPGEVNALGGVKEARRIATSHLKMKAALMMPIIGSNKFA